MNVICRCHCLKMFWLLTPIPTCCQLEDKVYNEIQLGSVNKTELLVTKFSPPRFIKRLQAVVGLSMLLIFTRAEKWFEKPRT